MRGTGHYDHPPIGASKEDAIRWYAFRRAAIEIDRERYENLRNEAHALLAKAIRAGRIAKPSGKCADCDKPATCYDHRDYRLALVVDAVCQGCNNTRGRAHPFPDLPRRLYKPRTKPRADAGTKRAEGQGANAQ